MSDTHPAASSLSLNYKLISETHSCHSISTDRKLLLNCRSFVWFYQLSLIYLDVFHHTSKGEKDLLQKVPSHHIMTAYFIIIKSSLCAAEFTNQTGLFQVPLTSLHTDKCIWLNLVSSVTFNRATEEGFSAGMVQSIRSYLCSATTAVPSNFLQWPIVSVHFYNLCPSLSCLPPPQKRQLFLPCLKHQCDVQWWRCQFMGSRTSCSCFCVCLKLCWSESLHVWQISGRRETPIHHRGGPNSRLTHPNLNSGVSRLRWFLFALMFTELCFGIFSISKYSK